ncbi:hypothetical protein ALQ23_04884, partial [Pseudomonas syringae pv. antirrhini]
MAPSSSASWAKALSKPRLAVTALHQRNDTVAISDRSVLCVYRYDPLDRLGDCSPAGQGSARFFYQKNRLTTQIQGQ